METAVPSNAERN